MKLNKRQKIILGLLLASFSIGALAYGHLPEQVAIYWSAAGFPRGYIGRLGGAFLLPAVSLCLYLLFYFGRKADRRRKNIGRASKDFENFEIAVQALLLYMFGLILVWNLVHPIDLARWLSPAIGLVYITLANIVARAQPNWTIGIKTAGTLKSQESWRKTHRLARWLLYGCGFMTLYGIILPEHVFWFALAPVVLTAAICVVYSGLVAKSR